MAAHWRAYNNYIQSLDKKSDQQIHELVHAHFNISGCKSPASCFHSSVKKMFEIKTTTENGVEALRKLYPIYERFFSKATSLRRYLSQVRQVIKKKTGNLELWERSKHDDVFNMDKVTRAGIANDYKDEIKAKNKNKIQLDVNDIENKIINLSLSTDPYDKVLLILLCIGSRPKGVFISNNYKLTPDSQVEISGLTKKRDGNKTIKVIRPVLFITPKLLIKKWNEVRKYFKNKVMINEDGELSKDKNATLNKHAIQYFPWLKDYTQKSSMLRKIYADLSFKTFADKEKVNYNSWIQDKLGHEDLLTSFSYSYLNIKDLNKLDNTAQISEQIKQLQLQYGMLVDERMLNKPDDTPQRNTSKHMGDKIKVMEKLYKANTKISVRGLKKEAMVGTTTALEFLKDKRK